MEPFIYTQNPSRVIFGSGTLKQLPDELKRQSLSKPLLLSTPEQVSQAQKLESLLTGVTVAGTFSQATMHTPAEVTEKALEFLKAVGADSLVSIGGGSTIGLGKALSIRTGLPHICIPTTYAGSEMTPILGETAAGVKKTRSDPKIIPGTVVYDVDLTMTLPVGMSCTSGVNAIAHAVEALYATNANPVTSMLALEGIRSLATALPQVVASPQSPEARQLALYGAWLCSACLGTVGMSLHHKLCHTIGGSFNLPHAQTHTIVLPHALAYNFPKLKPDVQKRLGDAFPESNGDPVRGLNVLLEKLDVERALKAYGMKEEDIDKAADLAVANPYANPRKVVRDEIREVIRRAWAGEPAKQDL
ncbi:putative maleylacetate reductase [Sphaerosporella brunnea]|uniref:Putative maleylacetate reductase n=1 Tax=Sphaerosporella brunnea TaxID=1250544 RepID=A0A5J5EZ54_9PEZI|nr:putative maleylacetate reductase [Sphaerosporella brunnea]